MPLTPLDIHNKSFNKGFRGYDEDEVNEFLEQVMKDYELVLREKKMLEEKYADAREKLGHFNHIEDALNKSILVAQEAAEDVKRNAKNEAKLILKEAEKNADRIVNDSLVKAQKIAIEIEELKRQSKVFRTRFTMLVEAQLDLIKNEDWEHLMEFDKDATEFLSKEMES